MTKSPDAPTVTVELPSPIQAHGKELMFLTIREPGTEDFIAHGFPFKLDMETMEYRIDAAVCSKLLPALTGVPPSTIKKLPPKIFMECCFHIVAFSEPPESDPNTDSPAPAA